MSEQKEKEIPTAPEHGEPPTSDKHPAVAAAERYAELVGVIIKPIKDALEQHQAAELDHHRRVELQLKSILEQEQSFGRRLTDLERRVSRLELADTVPPSYTDTSEPGGDS